MFSCCGRRRVVSSAAAGELIQDPYLIPFHDTMSGDVG